MRSGALAARLAALAVVAALVVVTGGGCAVGQRSTTETRAATFEGGGGHAEIARLEGRIAMLRDRAGLPSSERGGTAAMEGAGRQESQATAMEDEAITERPSAPGAVPAPPAAQAAGGAPSRDRIEKSPSTAPPSSAPPPRSAHKAAPAQSMEAPREEAAPAPVQRESQAPSPPSGARSPEPMGRVATVDIASAKRPVSSRCREVSSISVEICHAAERICRLAEDLGDASARRSCEHATSDCHLARSATERCSQ